jgi:hypothetical protein
MPVGDRQWEFLLRVYEMERSDDRNDRGVFAALIGSLIAVVAVSGIFIRQAGQLPSWAYAGVPAAPLATLALVAYIAQVVFVRREFMRDLEATVAEAAEEHVPESLVRGHLLSWWSRGMWDFALFLTVIVVVGVSALALARTENTWFQVIGGLAYGGVLCIEVAAFMRIRFRTANLLNDARRRTHTPSAPRTAGPR